MADGTTARGSGNDPVPRLVLLATSPRVAPGVLALDAWDVLRSADAVWCGPDGHPQRDAITHAGVTVAEVDLAPRELADRLVRTAATGTVVWLLDQHGDPALSRAVAERLTAAPRGPGSGAGDAAALPTLELLAGSYDLPGAHLLDLVAVMDRLRSPGGCPWDAAQTHLSLVRYLVEEAYELVEVIEAPGETDRVHLREELGDVLLQVVFHARMAQDDADDPFDVDDVADAITAKLVHRHPHVFGTVDASTPEHVEATWEQQKAVEKGRSSVTDGIPPGLPALAAAEKLLGRASRAGLDVALPIGGELGDALLRLVDDARTAGVDPEAELRSAVRRHAERVRAAEGQPAG